MAKKPELIVIRTVEEIRALQEYLKGFEYISYDCETTGLLRTDQVVGISVCAEDDKAYYVILSYWDKESSTLVSCQNLDAVKSLVISLQGKSLIMHNGVFDSAMSEFFFKIDLINSLHTDTMVLAHLLDENRRIGLKELGKQYFGQIVAQEQGEMKASVEANGGSTTKDVYEMYKASPELLGRYGAQDAWITYKLFYVLTEELFSQGLEDFFYEHESMPLLRGPTYELNTTGLKMDLPALTTLKKTLEAECLEDTAFIMKEIEPLVKEKYPGTSAKTKFNLGSSSQLAWLLFGKMGLEFGTLTDGGKEVCRALGLRLPYTASARRDFIYACEHSEGVVYENESTTTTSVGTKKTRAKKVKAPWNYIMTDKKILTKHAPRYKWIQRLLDYQKKKKLLTTYVIGFEERIHYGIMHPSFKQTGTTSGRYSSSQPNFQNLPRDDKRIKKCIISRPGKVFVGADFSQLEPRTFADLSGDESLKASFNGKDDFYSVIGMGVYDKSDCVPRKEGSIDAFGLKYTKLRDLSKVIALATVYGATSNQLSATTGKSSEETRKDMDKYLNQFPGVKKFMTDSHDLAKKHGFVTSLFGRPRRIPEAKNIAEKANHEDLPYEQRTLLNLATNHRVQSTAASIVNRSMIAFYRNKEEILGKSCKIVTQVHDSLIVECDETDAEMVALLLQTAMENTVLLEGVPLEAKPLIGKTFAEV